MIHALAGTHSTIFLAILFCAAFGGGLAIAIAHHREDYRNDMAKQVKQTTWTIVRNGWTLVRGDSIAMTSLWLIAAPMAAWVTISWFWPLFVSRAAAGLGVFESAEYSLPIVGIILGASRIIGARRAERLVSLRSAWVGLEKYLMVNLTAAILAAISVAFLHRTSGSAVASVMMVALAGTFVLVAKGSEEIVKVFANVQLKNVITDAGVRATVISFSSVVSNIVGFVLIVAGVALMWAVGGSDGDEEVLLGFVSLLGFVVIFAVNRTAGGRKAMAAAARAFELKNRGQEVVIEVSCTVEAPGSEPIAAGQLLQRAN